jgi:hypothetical protein
MRRAFELTVVGLSFGYVVPLFSLSWMAENGNELRFLQVSWLTTLALLAFNLLGAAVLFRLKRNWTSCALLFCLAQVSIWWALSGLFATNSTFLQFLISKWHVVRSMLDYPDYRVRFVTFHQDIAVGIFYHIAMIWFVVKSLVTASRPEQK